MEDGRLTDDERGLAERHIPLARSLAWRVARRDRLEFGEVYSDALLGLVRAAGGWKPNRPFRPYARRWIEGSIAHGKRARTGMRRDQPDKPPRPMLLSLNTARRGGDADEEPLYACLPDPDAVAPDQAAEHAELWRTVDALPARQRISVRLTYQRGLSQSEIGRLLGVSQMQVSRYLRQATDRLAITQRSEDRCR